MLAMLVFYDNDGNVVGTLDHLVQYDEDHRPLGLVDFEAHELAGGKLRDVADMQRLDMPIPRGVAKKFLGRDPEDGEVVTLPPTHPFRIAHETVAGAATWPEWLGGQAHAFTVELDGDKRITSLVHRKSGHRRSRGDIEKAIKDRRAATPEGEPVDLRDLLGGPDRPILLDEDGKTRPKKKASRPTLPIVPARRPTRPDPDTPPPKGAAGRRPG